jgi:hypothetical protein
MITAGLVTSFKKEVLLGTHDLLNDVIKIALYTSSAELGPETTVYTPVGEVSSSGTNYTTGGQVLLLPQVGGGNGTGYATFSDPIWYATTFSVRGALIYNYTKGNKAIGVMNFGLDQVTLTQEFKIQFPAYTPESALIRIT